MRSNHLKTHHIAAAASILSLISMAAFAQGGSAPVNLIESAPPSTGVVGPLTPNFKQYSDQQKCQNAYHFFLSLQTDNPSDASIKAAVTDLSTKATDKANMYGLVRLKQKQQKF
ncbi:MAG: hypothetical protein K2Y22_12470 [Candidatus Obscuribacterales bacterium]|nr:hypothetical protein [Candidatus Obscuribacterales bacterium]